MKLTLVLLGCLLASAHARLGKKLADNEYLEKQKKVLKIYLGISADAGTKYHHVHQDFEFNKPELFKKPEALEKFLKVYKRGLLPRDGVFTMNCHKNRHDTHKLFDLFYFTKDFDTFYRVAEWAKNELHPMQIIHAFTLAVFHREDCKGLTVPPFYEIVPHFFVFSEYIHQALQAKLHDVKYRKFELNSTGWEWSWHREMTSGHYKTGQKWNGDDVESLMSYFREDVGLADWYVKFMHFYSPAINSGKYPDVTFHRRGELIYTLHNYLLKRYNLERYANNLPPVQALDFLKPIEEGYNPHMVDSFGRTVLARPDNLVPMEVNSYDFWEVDQVEKRYYDAVDFGAVFDTKNHSLYDLDEKNGIEILGNGVFGTKDAIKKDFYKPLYYLYLNAVNDMVRFHNDREYTSGVLGSHLTALRDPAYYKILASIREVFTYHQDKFHPYRREQLDFPGVKIVDVEADKLTTYFERFEFELTNGIPFSDKSERAVTRYVASKFRLNHKPFTFKYTVQSEKDEVAYVRVFIGPKTDMEDRSLTFNQVRHSFQPFDFFQTKVTAGENVIERPSHSNGFFKEVTHFRALYEKVNNSLETKQPYYYSDFNDCGLSHNLMLPKGRSEGKPYTFFVIVTPFRPSYQGEDPGVCGHHYYFDQHSMDFPFDRYVAKENFEVGNVFYRTFDVFHKHGREVKRVPV